VLASPAIPAEKGLTRRPWPPFRAPPGVPTEAATDHEKDAIYATPHRGLFANVAKTPMAL